MTRRLDVLGSISRRVRRSRTLRVALPEIEHVLPMGRTAIAIRSPSMPSWTGLQRIPEAAWGVLERMAESDPHGRLLRESIDDSDALELWSRVSELAARAKLGGLIPIPGAVTREFRAFAELSAVVADGSSDMELPVSRLLGEDADGWAARGPDGTWRGRLLGMELLMVSAWAMLTKDLRSAKWLARQPLRGGFRALCRHYAQAMQVLHSCARRADPTLASSIVLSLAGRPHPAIPFGHAWNWLVEREGTVFAVDLTTADFHLDSGRSKSIFNPEFDGTRWWNVSVFAANLANAYSSLGGVLYRDAAAAELFKSLARSDTLVGRTVLHRVIAQGVLTPSLEKRVTEAMRRRRIDSAASPSEQMLQWIPMSNRATGSPEALNELLDFALAAS